MRPSLRSKAIPILVVVLVQCGWLPAADTVSVEATIPTANEENLSPGLLTFRRTGTAGNLTVRYRLSGDARSDRQRGYLANARLSGSGVNYYRRGLIDAIEVPGSPSANASIQATSRGGVIASFTVTGGGKNYTGQSPLVTITDPVISGIATGSGGAGLANLLGRVTSVTVTTAGAGYQQGEVTVAYTGGNLQATGVPAATATGSVTVVGGAIQTVTVDNADTNGGYQSAPTVQIGVTGSATPAPTTVAAATANMSYYVSSIDIPDEVVVNAGQGYVGPTITIAAPPTGANDRASATAAIVGSGLNAVGIADPGYGYPLPTITVNGVSSGGVQAAIRPVMVSYFSSTLVANTNRISRLAIEKPGSGYPWAVVTDATGAGAALALEFDAVDGTLFNCEIIDGGSGYSSSPTVTILGGAPAGFVPTISLTVSSGSITAATILDPGRDMVSFQVDAGGYVPSGGFIPFVWFFEGGVYAFDIVTDDADSSIQSDWHTPNNFTRWHYEPAASAIALSVEDPIVEMRRAGGSYAGRTLPALAATPIPSAATVDFVWADADFTAPVGITSGDANGIYGSIVIPDGHSTVTLQIVPRRNGVGGARNIIANVQPPAIPGKYITNTDASATITVADADDAADIQTIIATAYPLPPQLDGAMPTEVQGRAEILARFAVVDSREERAQFAIAGDTTRDAQGNLLYGPPAELNTDYILGYNSVSIDDTAADYLVFNSGADPVAKNGDTTIKVNSVFSSSGGDKFKVGNIVCTDNPPKTTGGIYVVTGVDQEEKTVSITPGLNADNVVNNVTRLRRLAKQVTANDFILYGAASDIYFFAFPKDNTVPRGRRSIKINFVQSQDYKVRTPASATAVLADTSVVAGLEWIANAGRPNVNGQFRVVLSRPFPVDVRVPFTVQPSPASTATVYDGSNADGDYSIPSLNAATKQGQVLIKAGETSAIVDLVPRVSIPASTTVETVQIALDASPDYQRAPQGTSAVNPSVSVNIVPLATTTLGESVYVSTAAIEDAREAGGTAGSIRLFITDAEGNPLTGVLTSNLAVQYLVAGTATVDVDYQALSGTATIPSGQDHVDVLVHAIDDAQYEGNESVVVTLASGPGYQLSAIASTSLSIIDDEPQISVSAVTDAYESGITGSFTVTASQSVPRSTTVHYSMGGTATPGSESDYFPLPGTVVIPPGQTSVVVPVPVNQDLIYDPNETIILTVIPDMVSPPTYGVNSGNVSKTLVVHDVPVLTIAKATDAVEGVIDGVFTLTNACDQPLPSDLTVNLLVGSIAPIATPDSTTTSADADYVPFPLTKVIPAGSASVSIVVVAHADGITEAGGEKVTVGIAPDTLSPVTYITSVTLPSVPATASLTIYDPTTPILSIAATINPIEGGASGMVTITNTSATPWPSDLTVHIQAGGGSTATSGTDFTPLVGTATLLAGTTSVTVPVQALEDDVIDPSETVVVELVADGAYVIDGAAGSATLTITDTTKPVLTVARSTDATEGGSDGTFILTNTRTHKYGSDFAVSYSVGSTSTASAGIDYTALSGVVNFPASAATASITVHAMADDVLDEGGETVVITLAEGGALYDLGSPKTATMVIVDTTVDPNNVPPDTPSVTPVSSSNDSGGGCGVGSGLGLVLAGLGLAGAAALRRRQRREQT